MDNQYRAIELYASLPHDLIDLLNESGHYYVKMKYIARKYESVKDVFLNAYRWYIGKASCIVPMPDEAESAVWTFLNSKYLETHSGYGILKLQVPMEEAVFFRMSDWNKILNLRYVGNSVDEELAFSNRLETNGIQYEGDVYEKPYYPLLKKQLIQSWDNLFRYDSDVKNGDGIEYDDMQAGLWCIKRQWIKMIER